jgi:hypothetical protein
MFEDQTAQNSNWTIAYTLNHWWLLIKSEAGVENAYIRAINGKPHEERLQLDLDSLQ